MTLQNNIAVKELINQLPTDEYGVIRFDRVPNGTEIDTDDAGKILRHEKFISLPGGEGKWAKYRRLGLMSFDEIKERMKKHPKFGVTVPKAESAQSMATLLSNAEVELEFLMTLVEYWNLVGKDGKELPTPSINQNIWKTIPSSYLAVILRTIKNDPLSQDFLAST